MKERILFVDDDSNILEAFKRQMRKKYDVETALGGEDGLDALRNGGRYAVIVSDLRMPGMDGNIFLTKAKNIAPNSTRIMLTGYADLQAAMKAINNGKIFRLLTKPCPTGSLMEALEEGIVHYKKNIGTQSDKSPKKVLIADDDPMVCRALAMSIEDDGIDLIFAEDGDIAKEIIFQNGVDLVVSDLFMPNMNGLKLISYLRTNHPEIPVIVLTGYGNAEIESKIRSFDGYHYFEKPLDLNVFREVILKELEPHENSQVQGINTSSFLQLIDIEEKICTLTIRSGGNTGYLFFNKGELIDAETGELRGEEAAYHIIGWEGSLIEISNVCRRKKREINKSLMHILMESSRLKDEMQREYL
ncbi:MAG: response regulator [Deltaproteobacteria bacterium]|nr:response regulator [Deltaproteobacteria bacterium]